MCPLHALHAVLQGPVTGREGSWLWGAALASAECATGAGGSMADWGLRADGYRIARHGATDDTFALMCRWANDSAGSGVFRAHTAVTRGVPNTPAGIFATPEWAWCTHVIILCNDNHFRAAFRNAGHPWVFDPMFSEPQSASMVLPLGSALFMFSIASVSQAQEARQRLRARLLVQLQRINPSWSALPAIS